MNRIKLSLLAAIVAMLVATSVATISAAPTVLRAVPEAVITDEFVAPESRR